MGAQTKEKESFVKDNMPPRDNILLQKQATPK